MTLNGSTLHNSADAVALETMFGLIPPRPSRICSVNHNKRECKGRIYVYMYINITLA